MLHSSVGDQAGQLRRLFAEARPFRHVLIEPFLDAESCNGLISEFPPFDEEFALNERGVLGRKAVVARVARLGPTYAGFDSLMRDSRFLALMAHITGIPSLLYDRDYVGGGTHENLDGQELDPHVDFNYHPSRRLHRRLNLILFLNEEWEDSWGGCLELLRDPWTVEGHDRRVVVPRANRAVIFETTETSWHGFRRIRLPPEKLTSRRSIAVYFYTKDRPAEQTAGPHGTIYYQRPLPERFQAGYTLREEDAVEIQTLIARRDETVRFLYEREKKFSALIEGITRSPSFRLGRTLTWPTRAIRGMFRKG
jgi:hypothetical protein